MEVEIKNLNTLSNSLISNLDNPLIICLKYPGDNLKNKSILTALSLINDYDIDYKNYFCFFSRYYFMNRFNNIFFNEIFTNDSPKKSNIKFEETNFFHKHEIPTNDFFSKSNIKKIILLDDIFSFTKNSLYPNNKRNMLIESLRKSKIYNDKLKIEFNNLFFNLTISACDNNKHIFFMYNYNTTDFVARNTMEAFSDVVLSIKEHGFFIEKSRIKIEKL
jgi:hypothetical protein